MKSAFDGWNWQPPSHWLRIETIDMHTGGEPLRTYISGLPPIEGNTVLEKRRYFREHYDHLRTGTMWEPRGHAYQDARQARSFRAGKDSADTKLS
jgi:trans-L-3-hydroxyproline dehydratase